MKTPSVLLMSVVLFALCTAEAWIAPVTAGGRVVVPGTQGGAVQPVRAAQPVRGGVQPIRGVQPVGGRGRRGYYGGRVYTNVQQGPDSTHRPWVGSGTYDKNLGKRNQDGGRADFQRDRDATLDALHREEERARRIQQQEAAKQEQQQLIRDNKAVIEANARAAEAERKAREAERNAEIRRRAADQEAELLRRRAEQEKNHDAILNALPTCMGRNADGSPCTRKANPGHHYCHLHLNLEK